MDFTANPLSGFHFATSSPTLTDSGEDSSFTFGNSGLMIEVEPAPISRGHVVPAITQLPASIIQNCDDYLAALSQLSSKGHTLDLSVNQHMVSGQGMHLTATKSFFGAELPMVPPFLYDSSSNTTSQQSNCYPPAVAPPLFSSNHQLVNRTNQGYQYSGTPVRQLS